MAGTAAAGGVANKSWVQTKELLDAIVLAVPTDAHSGGEYWLEVGWLDEQALESSRLFRPAGGR